MRAILVGAYRYASVVVAGAWILLPWALAVGLLDFVTGASLLWMTLASSHLD